MPDTNLLVVDDDQRPAKLLVRDLLEQMKQCFLCFFAGGWPDAQTDNAVVFAKGIEAGIGEIVVEGNNEMPVFLRPWVEERVGLG